MRRFLLLILCLLLVGCHKKAGQAGLSIQWDASPAAEQVNQYNVYRMKGNSSDLVGTVPVGTTTFDVNAYMQGNKTTFCVTAINSSGESLYSNTLTVQRP